MKFIVDEQLPDSLSRFIQIQGYDAVRLHTLSSGKHVSDLDICKLSMKEQRVVISKDNDFLQRFILAREPHKLLYVTTGNIKNSHLIALFEANFQIIMRELKQHYVVEMNQKHIIVIV